MPAMALKAKEFRYAVDLDEGGSLRAEDGALLADGNPAWSPEHLLLAALVRCSLKSLGYHARRGGIDVSDAHGTARALFTSLESMTAATPRSRPKSTSLCGSCRCPARRSSSELLANAERDCFVGASLRAKPTYNWTML